MFVRWHGFGVLGEVVLFVFVFCGLSGDTTTSVDTVEGGRLNSRCILAQWLVTC